MENKFLAIVFLIGIFILGLIFFSSFVFSGQAIITFVLALIVTAISWIAFVKKKTIINVLLSVIIVFYVIGSILYSIYLVNNRMAPLSDIPLSIMVGIFGIILAVAIFIFPILFQTVKFKKVKK